MSDLLACFFNECERNFRFLEEGHHFGYLSGLVEYHKNYKIIKPYKNSMPNSQISGNFLAITRYEREELALEIQFSKSKLALEGYMYLDGIHRLEFSEILAAAKKETSEVARSAGLSDTVLIEAAVKSMSTAIKEHKKYFISPSERQIERAATIRHTRLEQAVREHFKMQILDACTEAARAFTGKNYKRVVDLLEPVEAHLTMADSKKLNLARKHLMSKRS